MARHVSATISPSLHSITATNVSASVFCVITTAASNVSTYSTSHSQLTGVFGLTETAPATFSASVATSSPLDLRFERLLYQIEFNAGEQYEEKIVGLTMMLLQYLIGVLPTARHGSISSISQLFADLSSINRR